MLGPVCHPLARRPCRSSPDDRRVHEYAVFRLSCCSSSSPSNRIATRKNGTGTGAKAKGSRDRTNRCRPAAGGSARNTAGSTTRKTGTGTIRNRLGDGTGTADGESTRESTGASTVKTRVPTTFFRIASSNNEYKF